ncbi:hypothetical protein B0H16DRAFT_1720482 [Mycena metata]|uniref:Uncharacterized protein n=1 Tax=Mycena metata TaxID=1033252 RepID=A0AAD7J830_9AGAR|nr:hypothetical protein B0H16DRAFT_1720482 [Mycena metata]
MSLISPRGTGLPDASLPILASPLPPATAAKVMLVVILIAASLYYVSPTRLTRVLSVAMNKLDKVFAEVSAAGLLGLLSPEDMQTVVSTHPPKQDPRTWPPPPPSSSSQQLPPQQAQAQPQPQTKQSWPPAPPYPRPTVALSGSLTLAMGPPSSSGSGGGNENVN